MLIFFVVITLLILIELGNKSRRKVIITLQCILFFSLLFVYTTKTNREKYMDNEYNYDKENPNALVSGQNIAGTVFASEPTNTPGLGWVL